ncbi:MAG TPA: phenylacetate--CoA ligase family protein [Candidatus Atribacteria bacterium]|nr:phenylacetate--CoA ligase family protein [Candidatus Atribacteria bacterium]
MAFNRVDIETKFRRNILLPIYWKYIKHWRVLEYYKKLKEYQWKTIEENRNLQRKKLFELVKYAGQNIPYYKQIIQKNNIRFSEDTIFEDIKKFPILTKDIIRKNFDQLYKFKDNTYYRNTTSGSTGEPAIFYQDRHCLEWQIATKLLFDEWAGRKVGEPIVKLWGAIDDILKGSRGIRGYLKQQLYGVTTLNSYMMTEKNLYDYVQRINKIKPRLILAYSNSIDELCRFIQEQDLSVYFPKAIMTSAGVLFPEFRKRIEEVFHALVFDCYGSREVGDIACNCEKTDELHLIPQIHYLEILNDSGKEANQGESGEIIITLLTNYTMPLIRYNIEDRGVFSKAKCSCGREFPFLKKVEGRIRNIFRNKKGDIIDGGFFIELFYFRDYLKKVQVIQKDYDFIVVNLVLKDHQKIKVANTDFKEIDKKIKLAMGNETEIKFNIVDEIKPSPSGKYLRTFSQIDPQDKNFRE